ncbi:MAG: urocanate hydratase, partial [Candidatus Marinimicrobia bacterium]|nr:urocanate hydratase [Candidatus Neomarinimicrobiota bacterium]
MYPEFRPAEPIKAARGNKLQCKTWEIEAALRMLQNNLDPENCLIPEELIVYGGSGRAVRNWKAYRQTVDTLLNLKEDETLLMQSGKPVGVVRTHPYSPRVLIANSNIVPKWSTQDNFDRYDKMGLTMYGQMTAGSWIYIGTQGILQGTYQTLAALAEQHYGSDLSGKWVLTGGLGGMSGAQPLAVTMNNGVIINVEVDPIRAKRRVDEGYCMKYTESLDEAVALMQDAVKNKKPLSIALVGNCAEVLPEMVKRDIIPDIVTDQTSAHALLDYVPIGDLNEVRKMHDDDPELYKERSLEAIVKHTEAILEMQKKGAIAFDYGNNLRGQAELGGLNVRADNGKFLYPGFVPAYIRP